MDGWVGVFVIVVAPFLEKRLCSVDASIWINEKFAVQE